MSISMDGNGETAYSDFEFQHIDFNISATENSGTDDLGSTDAADYLATYNPLDRYGLDNDELAELVGLYREVLVSFDNYDGSNQTNAGTGEFRGVHGVNIDANDGLQPPNRNAGDDAAKTQSDVTIDGPGFSGDGDGAIFIYSIDNPGVLDHFDQVAHRGFVDGASGVGGDGTAPGSTPRWVNYRSEYGRGPVVDANDDLGFQGSVVKNSVAGNLECKYRATLVWDIHTVEGQRAQFSLP